MKIWAFLHAKLLSLSLLILHLHILESITQFALGYYVIIINDYIGLDNYILQFF